jgi:hypothetical protein
MLHTRAQPLPLDQREDDSARTQRKQHRASDRRSNSLSQPVVDNAPAQQPPAPAPCTPIPPTLVDEQLVFTCTAAAPRLFSPVSFRHGPHGQSKREQRRPPFIAACKTAPTHFSSLKQTSGSEYQENSRQGKRKFLPMVPTHASMQMNGQSKSNACEHVVLPPFEFSLHCM